MQPARPILLTLAALAAAASPLHAAGERHEPRPPAALTEGGASLAGTLLFDEPGDGALWVLGGTRYKARFTADGVTYFPRLGADAPRSEPLHLQLVAATRGDATLELGSAEPQRDGSSVSYDRGGLVELYELRPESMEQMFVLERLPGAGDLVLRVSVDTELPGLQTEAGLRFENERGGATYSRAFAFDASGAEVPVTTTWTDGEVELRVAAQALESAELPLLIDPVIETFGVTNDNQSDYAHSDVAYDAVTDRFAVVWAYEFSSTDSDVFMTLYDSDGAPVLNSMVGVDISDDCWTQPQVANNGFAAQFLTVARTSPSCTAASLVEGRTRQAATNVQGTQFVVSDLDVHVRINPDVGGNAVNLPSTYYCVVWQRNMGGNSDLQYQLVRTDASLKYVAPQDLAVFTTHDERPAISKTCGRQPTFSQDWIVTWEHRLFDLADRDVFGAQIHWSGQLTTPAFQIDGTAFEDTNPQPSSLLHGGDSARPYMVVWERGGGVDPDIQGAVLVEDQLLSPSANLSMLEGGSNVAQHQTRPVVDSDGHSFTVAYREHTFTNPANRNVFVSTFRLADGELMPIEVHESTGFSLSDQDLPAISSMHGSLDWTPAHPGRSMVTWQEYRQLQANWAIEGALYENLEGTEAGVPLCFGDGTYAACPCGNESGEQSGCLNTTGMGARLSGQGSNRVALDDLQLVVEHGVAGQPGLFFQGNLVVGAGNGAAFGDGLRCCGQGVVRLQVAVTDAGGVASTNVPVATVGQIEAGDTRCYQFWYRDPAGGGACGEGFNFSNGYEVLWSI